MALSYCSNWESLRQLNSDMLSYSSTSSFHDHHHHHQQQQQQQAQVVLPQLLDETLFSFGNNSNNGGGCFELSDTLIDPFLPPDEFFYGDSYTNLLPYFSSPSDALISLSPEIFPPEDLESCQLPKRQKSHHCHSNFAPNFFYGYVPNPPLVPEFLPEIQAPVTQFQAPKLESSVKKPNGTSLSVQSIAARERRRRITEKTQELGKLIPGGHRMNTAEMFQAASKYVKFLQAQVKVLQLIQPKQQREMKEPFHTRAQDLQNLLASPIIQEKLYSEDKCLVPKEFVETLANDPEIQSKPMVFQGIDQLLRTNIAASTHDDRTAFNFQN